MSGPLPQVVGGLRVCGWLAAHGAGVVLLAEDASGGLVSVAVLGAGAASDPAARERFGAAVRGWPGVVGGVEGGVVWAALPYAPEGVTAGVFLDRVWAGVDGVGPGPGFVPHWVGSEPVWPSGGRRVRRWVVWTVLAAVVLAVLLALLVGCEVSAGRRPVTPPPTEVPMVPSRGVPVSPGPSGPSGAAGNGGVT